MKGKSTTRSTGSGPMILTPKWFLRKKFSTHIPICCFMRFDFMIWNWKDDFLMIYYNEILKFNDKI